MILTSTRAPPSRWLIPFSELLAGDTSGRAENSFDVPGFAFGFPLDPEKSADCSGLMVVLGIEVDLQSART